MEYRPVTTTPQLFEQPVHEPAADIMRILGVVRRQYKLAVVGAVLAALLAVVFLLVIEPSYRSSVRILLDQDRTRLLTEISGEQAPASADEYIATQIAIINSDIVALRVIHNLGLTYDGDARRLLLPADAGESTTKPRLSRVTSEFLASSEVDPALVNAVKRSISPYQVDKGLVIEIAANDPDPLVAQKLAAAYGQAYLTDQLSARFEATKSAGSWLEDRISKLREQSLEANAAVEKFRTENNLVSTDGRLVSDQQLGSLNEQLVTSRLAVARAAAKVNVFKAAVEKSDVNTIIGVVGSASEMSESAPIKVLRSDYLEVAVRARDVTARWGADNEQARILQSEVIRQSGMILDEAKRILEGYESELRTAQTEADAIAQAAASATGQSQADNSTLVALRSLEQRSASYNGLYQDYLARYQEAVQQQTLSLTAGRMISTAELPGVPVFPNKKIVMAFMLLLGAGAGGAFGVGRELMDRTFRARSDVERLGVDFLGYVADPCRKRRQPLAKGNAAPSEQTGERPADPILALAGQVEQLGPVLDTIRTGVEIHRRGSTRIVALVSLESTSSRSGLALALARREARGGHRVLLVDGDSEVRGLSHALAPTVAHRVSDVLAGKVSIEAAAVPIADGVMLLPADDTGAATLFPVEQLKSWGKTYDMVILDLPPAGPISAARAIAPAVDGYVCTAVWGSTSRPMLPAFVQANSIIESKLVGVVITDVNMARQHLYDPEVGRLPKGTTAA